MDLVTVLCERCPKNENCTQTSECKRAYFIGVKQMETNIFRMIYDEMLRNADFSDTEEALRYLLNRKILGDWDVSDSEKLTAIKSSEWITNSQKLLVKEIERWEED